MLVDESALQASECFFRVYPGLSARAERPGKHVQTQTRRPVGPIHKQGEGICHNHWIK